MQNRMGTTNYYFMLSIARVFSKLMIVNTFPDIVKYLIQIRFTF
jgi:hypothetical protein